MLKLAKMVNKLGGNYKALKHNCKCIYLILLIPISLILFACSSATQKPKDNFTNNPLAIKTELLSSEEQEQPINISPEIYSTLTQQFGLADDYIINGEYQAAGQVLDHFDPEELDSISRQNLIMLQTKLSLLEGNPEEALKWIKQLNPQLNNPINTQISIYQLKIQALYRTNQPFSSAIAQVELNQLLSIEQQTFDGEKIWERLMDIDYSKIQYNYPHQTQEAVRSWLSLALIAKRNANDYQALSNSLINWQQSHPNSSANALLNKFNEAQETNANQTDLTSNTNNTLAVLLPLTGKYANLGKAVQLGIIDSYYLDESDLRAKKLNFYDTNKFDSMSDLYQKILADKNSFIIGPLTKENVESFSRQYDGALPMVSLNYLADNEVSSFYQFGLSPSDEAVQAAKVAWQQGKSKALVIAPDSQWGQSVKNSFTQQWQKLGGSVIDQYNYTSTDKLSDTLAKYLGITDSQWRKYLIEKTIGEKTSSTAQRRKDIDMIFLISTPETARQIKPLLKFYYANNLPVFATSSIYTGMSQAKTDRDLNDIYFCDTTWLLNPTNKMQSYAKKYQQLWGDDYTQFSRLHSLGADAYMLSEQQQHLALLPQFPIVGNTGNIYSNNSNRLTRQLSCAIFKNGVPHAVN